MAQLALTIPHRIIPGAVVDLVSQLPQAVASFFGSDVSASPCTWKGTTGHITLTAFGFTIPIAIVVSMGSLRVTGDVPFPASLQMGTLEQKLHEFLTNRLAEIADLECPFRAMGMDCPLCEMHEP